jgi:hypothetical protein
MFRNYNEGKFNPNSGFDAPTPGKYRVRIEEAEETTSKMGADMIKLTLKVSGHSARVFHYIVDNENAQRNIDKLFDSFGIKPGDFNLLNWRGKVGAAQLKVEQYNGDDQARVAYFIIRSKQGDLPAWAESGAPHNGASANAGPASMRDYPGFDEPVVIDPDGNVVDLPF